MRRFSQAILRRALALLALPALLATGGGAFANGGSYATAGTGTYAQSLWWLDFTGYSDTTASGAAGQPFSFTLPNGVGTLTTTVKRTTGTGSLEVVSPPAWAGGGAFGHGAYNGIAGNPIFYWLNQTGVGTVALTSLVLRDPSGNVRNFVIYAADGENTNSPETITYGTTSNWQQFQIITNYADYNGGVPTLSGLGTASVVESAPASNDKNFNAGVILSSANPTQVSAALNGNEAVLYALSMPTITLNVNVAGRFSASDQFTAAIGYASPAATIASAGTSGSGSSTSTGASSVLGYNGITLNLSMASGSASLLSYYSGGISCSNSGPGASSYGGTNTVLPSGSGTSFTLTPQTADAISCTLTVTPLTQTLAGTVYNDANHNGNLDTGEGGTGVAGLYVKLAAYSGGSCQNPATAAAAVSAATGAYSLASVGPGAYCLILTNSSALANTTAYLPPGWIGTSAPTGVLDLTVTSPTTPAQNFGLYNGSQLTLTVFADTGVGGGTANDGVQNGTEPGMAGVTVNASVGATAIASGVTGGGGTAVLWLPAGTAGTVTLAPVSPSQMLATGGSAGNTGGSYARPNASFAYAAGSTYTGVSFGYVPVNSLSPANVQTAPPGGVAFFAHSFVAGSAGQVTFAMSASASPPLAGWNQVLYLDSACSGSISASDPQITAAVSAAAGQRICVLLKQVVPATAIVNDSDLVTLSASFAYSGAAAPAGNTLTTTDTTTVNQPGTISLTKLSQNVTQSGAYSTSNTTLPGNVLQYQITISNQGVLPVTAVVINDATPAFTTFVSAACPAAASLPSGLTACAVSAQPAAGAQGTVQWTFTGSLSPGSQTAVTYQVQVAQ
jgi:uncharacterized repeat protein (TIGR01451 family)